MKPALPTAAVLLLMACAPAQAEVGIDNPDASTPTSLYLHVIDFQDMPINTQVPDPSFSDSQAYSLGTTTLKCLDPVTNDPTGLGYGTGGQTSQVFHTAYGYSTPSYVEYDRIDANGKPRTHPERGISYDAVFDPAYPFVLEWYVAVYNGGGELDQVPTPTPGIVVAATLRAGESVSVNDVAYDSGPTLAAGRTEPAILVPVPADGVGGAYGADGAAHEQVDFLGAVDGKSLFRFRVPMAYEADRILRETGFNVRVDMFIDNPACQKPTDVGKEYVMPSTVAAYSSAEHRPRMDLAIMNPIRVEYLHPQFIGDELVVHAALNSVWGNYDVQEATADGIQLSISGPSPVTKLAKVAFVQRYHDHYHHQEAVDVTYVWDYKADRAAPGVYTVNVRFTNDQGTATASASAEFEIGKGGRNSVTGCGGVQESTQQLSEDCINTEVTANGGEAGQAPGVTPLAGVAALGLVAAVLRRRAGR